MAAQLAVMELAFPDNSLFQFRASGAIFGRLANI
jgi:hypothetical protein